MDCNCNRLHFLGFIAFSLFVSWASSATISDAIFDSHASTGRTLLQTKSSCDIDFENQNYTILTSRCKGPRYAADTCCSAFKYFACPFADKLNDDKTDCATTMFSYINLYGKYPPGLFANECKEGKNGLDCSNVTTTNKAVGSSHKSSAYVLSPMEVLSSCVSALILLLSSNNIIQIPICVRCYLQSSSLWVFDELIAEA
ncbi:hypothetical protein V2J09_019196 [Rumex salicifolius]